MRLIGSTGGKTGTSASRKTNCIPTGEAAGSELKKVRELAVIVISENEFKEMEMML